MLAQFRWRWVYLNLATGVSKCTHQILRAPIKILHVFHCFLRANLLFVFKNLQLLKIYGGNGSSGGCVDRGYGGNLVREIDLFILWDYLRKMVGALTSSSLLRGVSRHNIFPSEFT